MAPQTGKIRPPITTDYVRYAKLMGQLEHLASQSTAFIPSDVHDRISDSYRLFLSLLYCEKPVVNDAKRFDAQAGLEAGMGATLAALSGINSVSGPGMLDFESCQSLEKLVLDNEICGMAHRLTRGITPRDDFPTLPLFHELLTERHLLAADHTLAHLREEHVFPGPVIDRMNRGRWQSEGSQSLAERASREVEAHVARYNPPELSEDTRKALIERMEAEARLHGQDRLPERDAV